jgi:hypothetical protein
MQKRESVGDRREDDDRRHADQSHIRQGLSDAAAMAAPVSGNVASVAPVPVRPMAESLPGAPDPPGGFYWASGGGVPRVGAGPNGHIRSTTGVLSGVGAVAGFRFAELNRRRW